MAKLRRSDDDLPLSPPVFYVLLALADEPRHGYAIMLEVDRRTEGKVKLLPGSLYSTIRRMVGDDLIEEHDAPDSNGGDERRRYYRITARGRRVAAAEADRMATLLAVAREKRLTAG